MNKQIFRKHSFPTRPWAQIGADLFELEDKHFLVTVDYDSSYIDLDVLTKTSSSSAVIRAVKVQLVLPRHTVVYRTP